MADKCKQCGEPLQPWEVDICEKCGTTHNRGRAMRRKPEQPKRSVDVAYMHANSTARDLIQAISEAMDDMPAPENDEQPIHWGHVGDVVEVNRRLSELLGFLTGSER